MLKQKVLLYKIAHGNGKDTSFHRTCF